VICLGEGAWALPEVKADTVRGLGDLASDPAGRQMLNLFKVSGLVAFQDEQLAAVRALRRLCNQRRGASGAGGGQP